MVDNTDKIISAHRQNEHPAITLDTRLTANTPASYADTLL